VSATQSTDGQTTGLFRHDCAAILKIETSGHRLASAVCFSEGHLRRTRGRRKIGEEVQDFS
jgi:hypothetical protein